MASLCAFGLQIVPDELVVFVWFVGYLLLLLLLFHVGVPWEDVTLDYHYDHALTRAAALAPDSLWKYGFASATQPAGVVGER